MLLNILLFGLGIWLVCLAVRFASQQATKAYYTSRTFTDFSGDVTAWLRCVSE